MSEESKSEIQNLNDDLVSVILKKNELSRLDYSNQAYDAVEEELHAMEDRFNEKHGPYLEQALRSVHDEFCPDSEVLLPIAYLAKKYKVKKNETGTLEFSVGLDEGVIVDVDNYADRLTRLVILPNPLRIQLQIAGSHREEVWKVR